MQAGSVELEAPDRSAALRVGPSLSTNNKCGELRRALTRDKVHEAGEYRRREFLTY